MADTVLDLLDKLKALGFKVNGLGQRDESWNDRWWVSIYRRRSAKDSTIFFLSENGDDPVSVLSAVLERAEAEPRLPDRLIKTITAEPAEMRKAAAKKPKPRKAEQLDLLGDAPAKKPKPKPKPSVDDLLG